MPSPATVTSPARLARFGSVWAVPTPTPRNSRPHVANSPRVQAYSRPLSSSALAREPYSASSMPWAIRDRLGASEDDRSSEGGGGLGPSVHITDRICAAGG